MDTQKAKKTMIEFKRGELVKAKNGTNVAGIIVKKLSETSYGKPIYQIVWQNDTKKESYEPHENLEKYSENQ